MASLDWLMQQRSVRVGKLWIPGRQVEKVLARYTKQIFCLTHHEDYPYSFLGSSSGVRYGGQCFMAWCRHQTIHYSPDDVTIPIDNGKILISGSQYLAVSPSAANEGEDYGDLCAMRYVPQNYGTGNLESEFFEIREEELWPGGTDHALFLFGFPTVLRRVDYEPPHVHVTQVFMSGQYVGPSKNAAHLHRVKLLRTKDIPLDGFSGGPVYYLGKKKDGFFMGLAGIIVRGGGDYAHFIGGRFLVMMLKRAESA